MRYITVITAAYGVDTPQPQPAQALPEGWETRWYVVSDRELELPSPWERLFVEPRPHLSDRMASKVPKYLPSLYTQDEFVVWLDASVRLREEKFVAWVMYHLVGDDDPCVALIPHPDRTSIRDEAPEAAAQGRYRGQRVLEQAVDYLVELDYLGLEDDRLWCSTVVGWHQCDQMIELGRQWMMHNVVWSAQDQLSLSYLMKRHSLNVASLDVDLWDNPWFTLRQRTEDK